MLVNYSYVFFFTLKIIIYHILFLIIKYKFQNEKPNNILISFFSFKIIFLLYCTFYFFTRDGLINYAILTIFGIAILLATGLISPLWFSLKDVGIELILCSVRMICFHMGINITRCKKSLQKILEHFKY